jgi:uncharacterized membrane protein
MDSDAAVRILLLAVMVGSGVLLLWMARAAASGRLRRNPFAGIRVPSTMVSDEAWLAAHVRAERPTMLAGLVSIASGLIAVLPVSTWVLAIGIVTGCVVMLGFILYGARVGSRAAVEVSNAPEE